MKEENEINDELRQLLDTLDEHGKNTRRQQQLSDLIDHLAEEEKTAILPQKQRKFTLLWWAMGAAAVCLLLWLILKPTENQIDNKEQWLAKETLPTDTVAVEISEEIAPAQEPVLVQEPIAEKTPIKVTKPKTKKEKLFETTRIETEKAPVLAQVEETETVDSVETKPTTTLNELPQESLALESQVPKRRVIKSESLVGYGKMDKQPEINSAKQPVLEDKTIFGQPQDPNMKNGMLAMEINLENQPIKTYTK